MSLFVDTAKITLTAGAGGDGCVAFHREKYIAAGGPSGGDGGHGGSVYLLADDQLSTLSDFRYRRKYAAQSGAAGESGRRSGKSGEDLTIRVPRGTLVKEAGTGRLLADISGEGPVLIAKGGRGGWGNVHFKSSTNQAPERADSGKPGDELAVWLRLKLIADIGLIGFPNAGKSTLLSVLTAARPKIANYPFTTLHPNLGVLYAFGHELVLADIPGLIEGAAEGAGLGHRFLGHVERSKVLLHLVDGTGADVVKAYKTIRSELKAYSAKLARKKEIVLLTKVDAISPEEASEKKSALEKISKKPVLAISAVSGAGLEELKKAVV